MTLETARGGSSRARQFCLVAVTASIAANLSSAAVADTPQYGNDIAYIGLGEQYGYWNLTAMKLRLKSSPEAGMSTARCMDAFLDWGTGGSGEESGHYDGRIVRSCKPGTSEETDPGGNGTWEEPPSGRNLVGIQKGWGYVIYDHNLAVIDAERFASTGTLGYDDPAPGTGTQGYARVRTRYEDGTVKSCNPLPVTSPDGSGGCS